jgi:DNA-binding NarL/FixJ family response regulator
MVRILVADDHVVMRRGLRDLLAEHKGWEVCGEAENGREAVDLAVHLRPDVAVLDISMPELNGLEATRRIRKQVPDTEVLIFTLYETDQLVREVLRAGARGYVLKSDAALHLTAAVEALAKRQAFFTPGISKTLLTTFLGAEEQWHEGSTSTGLTTREREVVQMLAEGKTNKEVAATLYISLNTVETHRATIMRKLGCTSIVEIVRYAVRNQLIEP